MRNDLDEFVFAYQKFRQASENIKMLVESVDDFSDLIGNPKLMILLREAEEYSKFANYFLKSIYKEIDFPPSLAS